MQMGAANPDNNPSSPSAAHPAAGELNTDVLVIGGGPVGLTAVALLGRLGVDCVAFDRDGGPTEHPKATVINVRTMEILRMLGLSEGIRANGVMDSLTLAPITAITRVRGRRIKQVRQDPERVAIELAQSPTSTAIISQDALEPLLVQVAQEAPLGEVRFEHEVIALTQDEEGVTAKVRGPQGPLVVRAQYAIAADGSRGPIREALGIERSGRPNFGSVTNIHFRADLSELAGDCPSVLYWLFNGERAGVIHWLDGSQRWLLNTSQIQAPDEDGEREMCLEAVAQAIGDPAVSVELLSARHWNFSASVADSYRSGRVFIAGDTAHEMPPTGGFGLNTGVQEVHNLAWKLSAVCHGWADDRLLDTYGVERRPVAEVNVNRSVDNALALGRMFVPGLGPDLSLVELDDEQGEEVRRQLAQLLDEQSGHFDFQGWVLGATYDSTAIVPDGTPAVEPADPIRDYEPTARPGSRAPHVAIDRDGARGSVLDLFWDRFVLLCGPRGEGWEAAAREAGSRGPVPLAVHRSTVDGEGGISDAYGIGPAGAALVRPDGYVAWRTAEEPTDHLRELESALSRATCRTDASVPVGG